MKSFNSLNFGNINTVSHERKLIRNGQRRVGNLPARVNAIVMHFHPIKKVNHLLQIT